jgi:hypothetical protein
LLIHYNVLITKMGLLKLAANGTIGQQVEEEPEEGGE